MKTRKELIEEKATVEVPVETLAWYEDMLREVWMALKTPGNMIDSDKIVIVADGIMNIIWERRNKE